MGSVNACDKDLVFFTRGVFKKIVIINLRQIYIYLKYFPICSEP